MNVMAGWIPFEEIAPPIDGTFILVAGFKPELDYPAPPCVVAAWDAEVSEWVYAYWDSAWRSTLKSPTHWLPLPLPKSNLSDEGMNP
jgi:hypothetical protein